MPHEGQPVGSRPAALECVVVRAHGGEAIGDRVTIRLRGELNACTSSLVPALVDEQLLDGRQVVCLDMDDVTFIDSASVGRLVQSHISCLSLGVRLVISSPSAPVAQILSAAPHPLFIEMRGSAGAG